MVIIVNLEPEQYIQAEEASQNYRASSKPGTYGKGLANTEQDPHKVERIALLGELAASQTFGVPVDLSYQPHSDPGYDLSLCGLTIDVKTATSPRNRALLIRATNRQGSLLKLKADLYLAAYLVAEDREAKTARIVLVGFLPKEEVYGSPLVPPRKNSDRNHRNYDLPYQQLHPVEQLLADLGIFSAGESK